MADSGRRTLRLIDAATGDLLGTGFLIGDPAQLVTAAHVIMGVAELEVWADDASRPQRLATKSFILDEAHDLAMAPFTSAMRLARAYSVDLSDVERDVRWFGYAYADKGLRGPVEGNGRLGGETAYAYRDTTQRARTLTGGSTVSAGMSGGPIEDARSGAVVAVVLADFTEQLTDGVLTRAPGLAGFAMPLAWASGGGPLAQGLVAASEAVARHGATPNRLAALDWFDKVATRRLAYAAAVLDFDPRRIVSRRGLDEVHAEHLASDRPIAPLVGLSGVGKSSWMLETLSRRQQACLYVAGADLGGGADLPTTLAVAATANLEGSGPEATLETVMKAAGPGVLFVDGLNETSMPPVRVSAWVNQLAAMLRRTGWKAWIAVRPEYWESLRPSDFEAHLFASSHEPAEETEEDRARSSDSRTGGVALQDFSGAEREAFLELHGMSGHVGRTGHPLTLALATRFAEPVDDSSPTGLKLSSLIHLYLEENLRKAAHALGATTSVRRASMRALLVKVASQMVRQGSTLLRLGDVATDQVMDLAALVDEGVLVAAEGGWRFRYDHVMEYLQAEAIGDVVAVVSDPALTSPSLGVSVPPAVIAAATARLGMDHPSFEAIFERAASLHPRLVPRLLAVASLSVQSLSWLRSSLQVFMTQRDSYSGAFIVHEVMKDPPWLGLELRMAVLEAYARIHDGYGWRNKDVRRGSWEAGHAHELAMAGATSCLAFCRQADGPTTDAMIEAWLSAEEPIRGSEATFASWTLNLLTVPESIDVPWTVNRCLAAEGDVDQRLYALAGRFARRDIIEALDHLAGLQGSPAPVDKRRSELIRLIMNELRKPLDDEVEESALRAVLSLPERVTEEADLKDALLARFPDQEALAWARYSQRVQAGATDLDRIGSFAARRPEECLDLLVAAYEHPSLRWSLAASYTALASAGASRVGDTALFWSTIVAQLDRLLRTPELAPFQYDLEIMLNQMSVEELVASGMDCLVISALNCWGKSEANGLSYAFTFKHHGSIPHEVMRREVYLCRKVVGETKAEAVEAVLANLLNGLDGRGGLTEPAPPEVQAFAMEMIALAQGRGIGVDTD